MLWIKRFAAPYLRNGKIPQRFQSNRRPTTPLGSRILLDPDKVFDHNMWDHMQWSQEEEEKAREKNLENSLVRVPSELQADDERGKCFGKQFPGSDAAYRILEVGCGAGNSVFPILKAIRHTCSSTLPGDLPLFTTCVMMPHPTLSQTRAWMLFFLSLSSLRFILTGSCLSENFYVRGDGTRAYFFTKDEIHKIFSSAGLSEVQNLLDRRLQVNRKKQVKMNRVWIQSKFQKQLQLPRSRQEDAQDNHGS